MVLGGLSTDHFCYTWQSLTHMFGTSEAFIIFCIFQVLLENSLSRYVGVFESRLLFLLSGSVLLARLVPKAFIQFEDNFMFGIQELRMSVLSVGQRP